MSPTIDSGGRGPSPVSSNNTTRSGSTASPPLDATASATAQEDAAVEVAVSKIFRHLIPVLFACYVLAFLDRINFGFAALTMNADLGITVTQFGIAATIFYVTYIFFEIPSNMLLVRFGARRWIARIMISWGVASMGTALATGPIGLYVARGFLGLAEAGFVPGIMLYLTYWIPAAHRARATALFMTAQPVAIAMGSPVSGAIMSSMNGMWGLAGWQWLFIVEATPTVILGLALLWILPDGPGKARWLTPSEKEAIAARLAREAQGIAGSAKRVTVLSFLTLPYVLLCIAYLGLTACLSTLSTWTPLIVKDIFTNGSSAMTIGLLTALPGVVAAIAMPFLSASSDRRQERAIHFAVAALIAGLGWFSTTLVGYPALQIAGLVLATAGGFAAMPILWTVPPTMLRIEARPVAIAVISMSGIAGALISPVINGFLRQVTGSYVATGFIGVGWMVLASVLIVLAVRLQARRLNPEPA